MKKTLTTFVEHVVMACNPWWLNQWKKTWISLSNNPVFNKMRYSLVLVGPVTCLGRAQIFDGLKSYHIRSRSLDQVHCYV